MKKFLKKVILYSLPVLFYMGLIEYAFYQNKELISISKAVDIQLKSKNEKYYFRSLFDNSVSLYKIEMVERKNPEILIIGQSTVLSFRKEMFHPFEDSFYNLGFSTKNIFDMEDVISLIKYRQIHKPKLILIGIDAGLVASGCDNNFQRNIQDPYQDEIYKPKFHLAAQQAFIKQFFTSQFLSPPVNRDIGIGYLGSRGTGFRKDGSIYFRERIAEYIKRPVFVDSLHFKSLLKDKKFIFPYPYRIDDKLVKELFSCLNQIKRLGIQIVIFFPPISNDFYDYFTKNTDFNAFFNNYLTLQDDLKAQNYEVIKFTAPSNFGLTDNYMLDDIHPGEVFVGHLLYRFLIARPQSGILKSVDTAYLKKMLTAKSNIPLSFMMDDMPAGSNIPN